MSTRIGVQTPNIYVKNPYKRTKADKAIKFLNEVAEMHFDPWQELILRDWLAIEDNGKWTHLTCSLVVARQEGKSELIIARLIVALYLDKVDLCIYSSHRIDSSVEIYRRMRDKINRTPGLFALTKKMRTRRGEPESVGAGTIGREAIETLPDPNDPKQKVSRCQFRTRKADGGRGFTADVLILDEAMVLGNQFAGDVRPTLSQRPNPQVIVAGSAGNANSEHFGQLRQNALTGNQGAACWHEWSIEQCNNRCSKPCDKHPDPWDENTWYQTNPSLGLRHKDIRWLKQERKDQGDEFFMREYLSIGTWPHERGEFTTIGKDSWKAQTAEVNEVYGKPVFAVVTSYDRTKTVFAVANWADYERTQVMIQISGSEKGLDQRSGTKWVVPRAKELADKHKTFIVIDTKGQAASFIGPLRDEEEVDVISPSALEYAQSCAALTVGINGASEETPFVWHSGQPELTTAVASVDTRQILNKTLWAWATPENQIDVAPLEAATLAFWGLTRNNEEEFSWGWGG
jgi:hypothetical protein